jgi:hypothetical protein
LREGYKKVFNLLTYSEDISQTTYQKSNLVATGTPPYIDVATAPNGTLTADKLIENTSFTNHFLTQTLGITVVGLDYNFSFYVKSGERTKIDLQAGATGTARINLITGVIETNSFPNSPIATDVGNGWWRISVTFVASSTVINPLYRIFTVNNLNQSSYVGDGVSGVYVWGFQLTQSSTVLPYEKTVVAPDNGNAIEVRRNSDGAELDIPFTTSGDLDIDALLDFVGWNLFAWSEQLQQPYWAKTNTTITTDVVVAPDGNTTGDILFETTTNGVHSFQRSLVLTNGQLYTVSFWIKDEGRNHIRITTSGTFGFGGSATAWLDLSLGVIVSESSGFDGGNLTLTPDGDWYKVSYTLPATATGTMTVLQLSLSPNGSNVSYVGNTLLGIAVWGLQLTESSTIRPYRQTLAIGEGQGSVSTWYDQSGNGRNASQGALTSQPRIVENGIITTDITTGKPSVRFLNAGLNLSTSVQLTPYFVSFFVIQRVPAVTLYTFGTTASTLYMMGIGGTNLVSTNIGGGAATNLQGLGAAAITRILSMTRDVNLISGYNNGTVMPTTRSNTTLQTYNAFGRINSLTADGYISEGIWWNQDFLIQRPNIETEINNYYGIY